MARFALKAEWGMVHIFSHNERGFEIPRRRMKGKAKHEAKPRPR
jgi:hypothetical protein